MKTKKKESGSVNELQLELKYCERCGGLWLRPVGGGQIYCVACGRDMAQLPSASKEPESTKLRRRSRRVGDDEDFEECGRVDRDEAGGAA